jgi:hypothetical protein
MDSVGWSRYIVVSDRQLSQAKEANPACVKVAIAYDEER